MNRRLLLHVTAPAVAVGLLLFAACFASMRYINRLQDDLGTVVSDSVASMQAARELEIHVRQLRYHSLLYMMNPAQFRLGPIQRDEQKFEEALKAAKEASKGTDEKACVREIEEEYTKYQKEQALLRSEAARGKAAATSRPVGSDTNKPTAGSRRNTDSSGVKSVRPNRRPNFARLSDDHPVKDVARKCQELVNITKEKMDKTVQDSQRASHDGALAMLILGLAGPIGGVVTGYGVARGLKRSIYRLSVRVQDMALRVGQAQRIGLAGPELQDLGSVKVVADGDLHGLDLQMQHIVEKLESVAVRLAQQQRELLRAEQLASVGQLAAGVAHEVRNPLTGIKLLVESALGLGAVATGGREPAVHGSHAPAARPPRRALDDQDLRVIHGEITKLEKTVQSFLSFARLPAPQRAPCDLGEVVRQAGDLVRGRAEHQHVELALQIPEQPVVADLDRGQIGTVLVNLLLNALDAMPGGGQISVDLDRAAAGCVRLTVADTGPGLPETVISRLFTPFVTTKPTGTGLGLSLSARILEEHGGAISGGNRPEGGARFVLNLPIRH